MAEEGPAPEKAVTPTSAGARLRIGVAGVGGRGRDHLETLVALTDRYELVAVCDLSESAAQAAGASSGVPAYSNLEEFFARANLDVVLIVTPRDTHHLVAKMAAAHGVHMLIETPLAQTRQMMDFLCEAVSSAGVKAEVAENMWRRPPERLSRMAVEAGLIGKIMRVSSYYDDAGDNHCYHTLSRMRIYAGADVDEVSAYSRVFREIETGTGQEPAGGEAWTHATLSFSNGVLGSCTYLSTWVRPFRSGHPRFFSVEGTDGFIVTGHGSPNVLRRVEDGRAVDYPLQTESRQIGDRSVPSRFFFRTDPEIAFQQPFDDRVLHTGAAEGRWWDAISRGEELDSIHRAVTTGSEPAYGLARARRDQELSIVITESARINAPLPGRIEADGETVWEHEAHEAFRRRWGFDPFTNTNQFMSWR